MNIIEEDERMGLPSASGLQRLAMCPGSWRAEKACPAGEESDDSLMGTRLHQHMEDDTTPGDPEEAEAVNWCRNTEYRLRDRYLSAPDNQPPVDAADIREIRMIDKQGQFSGKPDCVLIAGHKALVIDYKFGRSLAPAAGNNLQLAALAVLVHQHCTEIKTVYTAILQPYVSRQDPKVCRYDEQQLVAAEKYIRGVIAASQVDDAPLRPSHAACKYCRAQASCPATSLQVRTVCALDLNAAWEQWSPAKRREAYDIAKMARKWADAVTQKIETDLRAEVEIPGLVLGAGRKSFVITNPAAAFTTLSTLMTDTITAEAYTACCKVGVTDLDKLVYSARKATASKTTIAASKEWLRETLAECGETKVTKGSIKEVEA